MLRTAHYAHMKTRKAHRKYRLLRIYRSGCMIIATQKPLCVYAVVTMLSPFPLL